MKNTLILIALFIVNVGFAQSNIPIQTTSEYDLFEMSSLRSAAPETAQVTEGTIFSLNQLAMQELRTASPAYFTLEIPLEHSESLVLELSQVEIFSEDFILESSGGEDLSNVDLGVHYRGTIQGMAGSIVAISVYGDQIRGIAVNGADNYNLGPIELGSTDYICYKSMHLTDDIKSQLDYSCSSVETLSDVYSEEELNFAERGLGDIVRIYVEVDRSIYIQQGSNLAAATAYVTSLVNQNATIYGQEGIGTVASQIFIWTTVDPYDGVNGCSTDIRSKYLCDFQAQFNGFNGDLALLLINENIGGVAAGFSGLCNANPDLSMCIAGQNGTVVNTFPTYSYNTYIFAHELGHLFGSRHTHACVWNGNNTAIDGCSPTEGACPLPPVPASGSATVMSYCQSQLAGGYISSAPFGTQPGNVIRASVAGATCIGCTFPKIYIPTTISSGPAVYKCSNDAIPTGYVFASSQWCAQDVINNDSYCLGATGGTWDNTCQAAYNSCFSNCSIYLPNVGTSGPAVYVCPGQPVPAGYSIAASQPCAEAVINNDPFCLTGNWDSFCISSYDACRGASCTGATTVYLPDAGITGPAIRGCGLVPVGYTAAASQPCAQAVVNNDPFCLTDNWDSICISSYDACRGASCTGATTVYLPDAGVTGPAIRGCGLVPVGYTAAASQPCAQAVVNNDPFCLTDNWDSICISSYDACRGASCTGATTVYLPDAGVTGPAIRGCGLVPVGYTAAASQPCAQAVVNNDPWCLTTSWDITCQNAYNACRGTSCTGATIVYLPNTGVTGPAIRGCGLVPVGYTAAPSQACANAVVNNTPSCLTTSWSASCQAAYDNCVSPPPTCTDGIQNGNETGVDCGGPDCPACPTCDDGIQNGNETGVDCGGPDCPACPTCFDGIQNGNETGVDCGGPDCTACPTCDDSVQNGFETGVDCGGPDCPACPCTGDSNIYLPVAPTTGPAVIVCAGFPAPAGYAIAANQSCAQTVIDNDPFCLTNLWDEICQGAYDACVTPACQAPNTLDVVEIGFGTSNPRVNATWVNPEGTVSCEVRGGRISNASYTAGEPEFANALNTQTITQTNGSTVNFNIALYNNPNIPFTVGARYGYEVRCACSDNSGFSSWANITPEATFVVPAAPAGVELASTKLLEAGLYTMRVYPNPTAGQVNIQMELMEEGSVEILIQNTLGQTVAQERVSGTSVTHRMDVTSFEAGIYLLSVRTASGVIIERLIVE